MPEGAPLVANITTIANGTIAHRVRHETFLSHRLTVFIFSPLSMATAVEATAMKAAAMEAANARLSSEAIGPRISSVPESTEGAGMRSLRHVRSVGCMKRLMACKASAVRIGAMKPISIDDGRTMREVRVVVVDDPSAAVPIESPSVPTPAETAKWSDPKR